MPNSSATSASSRRRIREATIVVYSVFIAAAQLRNDSTIYHNFVNLFAIFTYYHAVPFLMIFQRKRTLEFSLTVFFKNT